MAFVVSVILPGFSSTAAAFQQQQEEAAPPAPVYDEAADAAEDIATAIAVAGKENKRVLIQWGANWCGWCKLLHGLFKEDRQIGRKLQYEYEVVYVDVGRFDKNLNLAEQYTADLKGNGIPFLTVLAGDGSVVTNQETGSLEEGKAHDPAKVLDFLTTHEAEPLKAEELLDDVLKEAGRLKKRVFLTFGAPW